MGLFKNMLNKFFHAGANAEAPPDAWKPGTNQPGSVSATTGAAAPRTGGAGVITHQAVDIHGTLDRMAAAHHEKLDWQHSIVDLMKLAGMESSLAERKELAADLKYTGDTNDSATMNIWLHKEVMRRLSENAGKLTPELLNH
jgi:hypothetical protein